MTATILPFVPRVQVGDRPSRLGLFCEILPFKPRHPPVFESIMQALLALSCDKLGTVTRRTDRVFVMTIHGSGEFPADAWDAHARKRG